MRETSATVAAMRRAGMEVALDGWLAWNDATDVFDAELIEAMPTEFHDEYLERLSTTSASSRSRL
jgi:hypothetical protein